MSTVPARASEVDKGEEAWIPGMSRVSMPVLDYVPLDLFFITEN